MSTALVGGLTLPYAALLAVVALQRIAELVWSRRNLRALDDPRAAESPAAFRAMVIVHVGLIALPALEASARATPVASWVFAAGLALFALAQALRYWALSALGRAWNARAVVDPGLGVVTRGPYRWIRHPNYVAVMIEFISVPLAGGAWISLVVLNAVHALVLARRVRAEEERLDEIPGYAEAMHDKARFLPRWFGPGPRARKPARGHAQDNDQRPA